MRYKIYTDGAYSQIHDEGAFAYVILDENDNEIERKAYKITKETNNRAELKAIIAGVNKLPLDADAVDIFSDSQYALKTLSGEWGHKNNHDLFDVWRSLMISRPDFTSISYNWVRGHNGNKYNEICDQLCNDVLGYDANAEFEKFKKTKTPAINEEYAWKVYNFVIEWKNGKFGEIPLQQALNEHF